jgi:hypothetical protein
VDASEEPSAGVVKLARFDALLPAELASETGADGLAAVDAAAKLAPVKFTSEVGVDGSAAAGVLSHTPLTGATVGLSGVGG